jgi:hypothetical protein
MEIYLLQKLYHAVSLVGTLLLQIGEVGQKFDKRRGSSCPPTSSQPQDLKVLYFIFILSSCKAYQIFRLSFFPDK